MRTNADVLAEAIQAHGVPRVHVYPGGSVAPLLDALQRRRVELCVGRSESGAGFAAIGEARVTRRPAVVVVTCGPGHTNAVTTIADAYCDSITLLVLIGRPVLEPSRAKVRQRAFQDVTFDLSGICKAETQLPDRAVGRWAWECFDVAGQGRPGPVVAHLPMDVQQAEAAVLGFDADPLHDVRPSDGPPELSSYGDMLCGIRAARRPLVLAGAGIYQAEAVDEFRALIDATALPVVTSMPALGVLPSGHPLNFGMIGHIGSPVANRLLAECDTLFVLGSRLDVRQTGTEVATWREGKAIISVERDSAEVVGGRVCPDVCVEAGLRGILGALARHYRDGDKPASWLERCGSLRAEHEASALRPVYDDLTARDVVRAVDLATAGRELLVVTGSGAHQVHVARNMTLDHPRRRWISSCGLGTMGTGLPYAIGACQAAPGVPAVCFVGDAEIQHSLSELITIAQRKLPITVVVLDNRRLGLVSQFQIGKYGSDPTCHGEQEEGIEWGVIGAAMGLPTATCYSVADVEVSLGHFGEGPALLHCLTSYEEECWPMMLNGDQVGEMSWPKEAAR